MEESVMMNLMKMKRHPKCARTVRYWGPDWAMCIHFLCEYSFGIPPWSSHIFFSWPCTENSHGVSWYEGDEMALGSGLLRSLLDRLHCAWECNSEYEDILYTTESFGYVDPRVALERLRLWLWLVTALRTSAENATPPMN